MRYRNKTVKRPAEIRRVIHQHKVATSKMMTLWNASDQKRNDFTLWFTAPLHFEAMFNARHPTRPARQVQHARYAHIIRNALNALTPPSRAGNEVS